MKVLVTGGCGFIGSALIRNILIESNDYVHNIDKLTYAGNQESIPMSENNRYAFSNIDICDDYEVFKCIEEFKPNLIMHLAAESHVDRSIDGPSDFINSNINGTFNLLEQSLKFFNSLKGDDKNKFRFHHISTDEVYGDLSLSDDPFTEKSSYLPSSPYSASKAASDHLVRSWGRTYKLPVLITNCSNNYGPYHFPEKLIPHTILNAIHGKPIPIYGDGSQIRDWLFVEDHVKALLKVAKQGVLGETYNIGGHNEKSNLEVVESICNLLEELLPKKPTGLNYYRDLITFVRDRPGHDMRYAINASKIQNELGWIPEETFDSGLRKTVQWYIDNTWWWKRVLSRHNQLKKVGD